VRKVFLSSVSFTKGKISRDKNSPLFTISVVEALFQTFAFLLYSLNRSNTPKSSLSVKTATKDYYQLGFEGFERSGLFIGSSLSKA